MSKDPSEKEQDFINGLPADTGRDLAAWMSALDGQVFSHRNDMIDWLRRQGFTFSRASRLERLHHNRGKPLYAIKQPPEEPAPARAATERVGIASAKQPMAAIATEPRSALNMPAGEPPPGSRNSDCQSIEAMLAKAKGYRPLAELVLRELHRAVPNMTIAIRQAVAYAGAPTVFAALTATAKDVRLVLDLGDRPSDDFVRQGRLPGAPANLSHIIILNDARKVDATLISLFGQAHARANP